MLFRSRCTVYPDGLRIPTADSLPQVQDRTTVVRVHIDTAKTQSNGSTRSQVQSRKLHLRSSLSGFAHAEPAQQGKIGCRCQSFLDQREILCAAAGCSLMRLAKIARDIASVPGRTQPLKRKRHHPSADSPGTTEHQLGDAHQQHPSASANGTWLSSVRRGVPVSWPRSE